MEVTDQTLLANYLAGRDEAFRELLDRHSGLVYGVAVRAVGDPGSAEEVVQDVFLLLARKAKSLAAHPSLAGWLHLTSRNIARHALRQNRTRDRHHTAFKNQAEALRSSDSASETNLLGEEIDHKIERLSKPEREAILLRFYEDRDYSEIASRLRISEAAARQRVSRGLKRLQKSLGTDLAGGATLASLAIIPPPGLIETILGGVSTSLATGAATTATTTGILTIMTKQTAITLVASIAVGTSILLYEVDQHAEKKSLRAQVEGLENSLAAAAAAAEEQTAQTLATRFRSNSSDADRIANLEAEIEAARAKTAAAEKRANELEAVAAQLDDQVVVAYGKVEEIGGNFGNIFAEALALSELEKKGELDKPANMARYAEFIQSAASLGGLSQEIINFDGDPEEGSRFFAATYAEIFGLNKSVTGEMQSVLADHFAIAAEREITLSDLDRSKLMENPANPPQEIKDWFKKRQAYYSEIRNDLRNLVPLNKQSQFDKWVEKGGIGFKNIKLKEHHLAFSLGGDQ